MQRAVELRQPAVDGERLLLGEELDGAEEVRPVPDDGPADADAPLVAPVVRLSEPDRSWSRVIALRLVSRKYSSTSPLNRLVPLLVTVLTRPATLPPCSADACATFTRNSRTASCGISACCWPELVDQFDAPSTK